MAAARRQKEEEIWEIFECLDLDQGFKARNIQRLLRISPLTGDLVLHIPRDFLVDDFNQCNLHRFPHWINYPGDTSNDSAQDRIYIPSNLIKPSLERLFDDYFVEAQPSARKPILKKSDSGFDDDEDSNSDDMLSDWYELLDEVSMPGEGPNSVNLYSYLYTMLHQRFALTKAGMHFYALGTLPQTPQNNEGKAPPIRFFTGPEWKCPQCPGKHRLLPFGEHYEPRKSLLRGFCPQCACVFSIPGTHLDGALYGPSFAPLFCILYPVDSPLNYDRSSIIDDQGHGRIIRGGDFEPRVFGFRLERPLPPITP